MTIPRDPTDLSCRAVARASAHAVNYIRQLPSRAVSPRPIDIDSLKLFCSQLPAIGTDALTIIDQLHSLGSPATMATTGGRFFGLVVGGVTPAAMGAAVLTAAWDQIAIVESTAPSAVHIERLASRWILQLLGLPASCSVGFTTGSSVANLTNLAAARDAQYRRLGVDLKATGLAGAPPLRYIVSEQCHITVTKALGLLGIGTDQLERVPCDGDGRIIATRMPPLDSSCVVCLQAGNVNSGASDSFVDIVPVAKAAGAWVHVDGAFGLWAAASPSKRSLVAGVEYADSWAVDAHKWLNTPYDCGIAICSDNQSVHSVMTTEAPYLTRGGLSEPKDLVPEFSRRARGVEVWATIMELGAQGIATMIERCCSHARRLSAGLTDMGYTVLNEVALNVVVASIGTDEDVVKIAALVQSDGECWFGTTRWNGHMALRLSVCSWATSESDIERTLAAISRITCRVLDSRGTN